MIRRGFVVLVGAAAIVTVLAWPNERPELTDALPCDEMELELDRLTPAEVGAVFDQMEALPSLGGYDGDGRHQIVWVLPDTQPSQIAHLAAQLEAIDGVRWVKRGTRVDGEYAEPPRCVNDAGATTRDSNDP